MVSRIIRPVLLYIVALLVMAVGKLAFMLCLPDIYGTYSWAERWNVIIAGQIMDNSLAGCITLIPALLTVLSSIMLPRVIDRAMRIYYIPVALLMGAVWVTDTILYSYWGIKIDITPFFYFSSSPALALASAPFWQICLGASGWLVISAVIWGLFSLVVKVSPLSDPSRLRQRWPSALAALIITLLLIIPIRGGLKAASSNLASAYFSADPHLNHAAVNPVTSLVYSASRSSDFGSEMHYMEPAEAARISAPLMAQNKLSTSADTLLSTRRPDIFLIILESFSSKLLPVQGGENIAPKLDSIARQGLLFSQAYASSFRTDRALPAILSGIPAPPTQPLLMHKSTAVQLPALPAELRDAGYATTYYYGGDVNFANQKAYLSAAGIDDIVSETDFPEAQRLTKWGVRDADLFTRVTEDLSKLPSDSSTPRFTVVQTLSSHEPFDVGEFSRHDDPAANAFAYTDSCLGAFLDRLATSPRWDETLVVITPDHYGCYPKGLEEASRHHIPVIMTGGALARHGRISTPASQSDLAATLLAAVNLPSDKFPFSRDILSSPSPSMAFFSEPDFAATVGNDGHITRLNITGDTADAPSDSASITIEAYLQTLYSYLSGLSTKSSK